ncbi:VCBS repeat-containing protein [Aliiglaciecola litoralis]|uniref:Repeat domain-containing protein n=1 Tax=Aliiglaciecola litoralis TaxID=582857 RepID=A0ABP3X119_9ALTE
MDGEAVDIDGDGDMDLVLAIELGRNILLTNNNGVFTSSKPFAARNHDSEDVVAADFDGDGDKDILFVTEDDITNEFYLNNGGSFTDVSNRIPVGGRSNAVTTLDANNDGHLDIVIGNDGTNRLLLNDGNANFIEQTDNIIFSTEITQDVEAADIDNDGDLDLLIGNENQNKVFINNGDGTFSDESATRLPDISAETRDIETGDIDGDGDLDIIVSNVAFFESFSDANYVLINDGTGHFTQGELPSMGGQHADSDLVDLDLDGDLDLVSATTYISENIGSNLLYLNDASGTFTGQSMPGSGNVFDIIAEDFDGDGKPDLYFCNRKAAMIATGFDGGQDTYYTTN